MPEQIYSMTNWMQEIKRQFNSDLNLQPAIDEDLDKFPRLAKLSRDIGLPIDNPLDMPVEEFLNVGEKLEKFFAENNRSGRYSIKAQPLEEFKTTLHRNRAHNVSREEAIEFVKNLKPDPLHYSVQIWEFFEPVAGGIFVVMEKGIYGEFTWSKHFNLTQGLENPITGFLAFDKNDFQITDEKMEKIALSAFNLVKTNNSNYSAINGYVKGYFEFIYYGENGCKFIDYNTGKVMNNIEKVEAKRRCACPGKATGRVCFVKTQGDFEKFKEGDVLVTEFTDPLFVPLMSKASAIITTKGGLLSHAAIISRELKKPCIVGMTNAFEMFKDGDEIEVDADSGTASLS